MSETFENNLESSAEEMDIADYGKIDKFQKNFDGMFHN